MQSLGKSYFYYNHLVFTSKASILTIFKHHHSSTSTITHKYLRMLLNTISFRFQGNLCAYVYWFPLPSQSSPVDRTRFSVLQVISNCKNKNYPKPGVRIVLVYIYPRYVSYQKYYHPSLPRGVNWRFPFFWVEIIRCQTKWTEQIKNLIGRTLIEAVHLAQYLRLLLEFSAKEIKLR